jgi:hypothetical protein
VSSRGKGDAIDGRRRRGCVSSQMRREGGMVRVLVVGRNHLRLDGALVAVGRRALDIVVLVIIGAAVEVGRTLVLIGTTML